MKRTSMIVAAILLVAGLALLFAALGTVGFDFKKLGTVKLETKTYTVDADFDSIVIDETIADVIFAASEDGTCTVVCKERENTPHTVTVENGTLKISAQERIEWKSMLELCFDSEKMTVYLPKDVYRDLTVGIGTGDVEIPAGLRFESAAITGSTGDVCFRASVSGKLTLKVSTGDVLLKDVSAGAIDCRTSTGDIRMQSVDCKGDVYVKVSTGDVRLIGMTAQNIASEGSTGNVWLESVVAAGALSIERSTGNIRFEDSDAADIRIKTSTGDVKGTLRTAKIFVTKTSTGDIRVPDSVSGGRCEITTSTGDISVMIVK